VIFQTDSNYFAVSIDPNRTGMIGFGEAGAQVALRDAPAGNKISVVSAALKLR
jgi:hypothetical protein